MSIWSPSSAVAIALHSMCQPGRPRPHGLSQRDLAIFFVPRFPKREIADVFLVVFVVLHPAGRLQLRQIEVRQLSVIRKFIDAKINRFVIRLISEPARNERGDHRNHLVDVTLIGRGRKIIRAFDPQRFAVFEKRFLELRGEFQERNTGFARAADRFVVHVGDVHDAMHFVAAQLRDGAAASPRKCKREISDVRAAVNGRPAGVDVDLVRRSDGLVPWRARSGSRGSNSSSWRE